MGDGQASLLKAISVTYKDEPIATKGHKAAAEVARVVRNGVAIPRCPSQYSIVGTLSRENCTGTNGSFNGAACMICLAKVSWRPVPARKSCANASESGMIMVLTLVVLTCDRELSGASRHEQTGASWRFLCISGGQCLERFHQTHDRRQGGGIDIELGADLPDVVGKVISAWS